MQSVISRPELQAVKAFSPAQEAALRGLIADALIESGYPPRSTKAQSRTRSGSRDAPTRDQLRLVQAGPQWPDDDDVLLSDIRVMRALGIGRTKLFELIDSRQLKPVRGLGRKLKFRQQDVLALIDALAEAA